MSVQFLSFLRTMVYNNLRHTTGLEKGDLIYCFVDAQLPFGSGAQFFFFPLCNSADTSSIIMTFLTADGWGKNGLRKPFSFSAISNNYWTCVTTMEWADLPKDPYQKLPLTLLFYSLSIYLCRIKCLNVIFLEICEALELYNFQIFSGVFLGLTKLD